MCNNRKNVRTLRLPMIYKKGDLKRVNVLFINIDITRPMNQKALIMMPIKYRLV